MRPEELDSLHVIKSVNMSSGPVRLRDEGGTLRIEKEYHSVSEVFTLVMRFEGAHAFRYIHDSHCDLSKIHYQDVFETLVEIKNSRWLAEMIQPYGPNRESLHHYAICLEEYGLIEVIAISYSISNPSPPMRGV